MHCAERSKPVLTVIAFNRRRLQFNQMLSQYSSLNSNRYFRLMFVASVDILCTVPLATWVLILNVGFLQPWISWDNVHASFMNVYQFPALIWQNEPGAFGIELERWLTPLSAWIFFFIFGIHAESRRNYRTIFNSLANKLGASTSFLGGSSSTMRSSTGHGYVHHLPSPAMRTNHRVQSQVDKRTRLGAHTSKAEGLFNRLIR